MHERGQPRSRAARVGDKKHYSSTHEVDTESLSKMAWNLHVADRALESRAKSVKA
jgi:hypothetical protein